MSSSRPVGVHYEGDLRRPTWCVRPLRRSPSTGMRRRQPARRRTGPRCLPRRARASLRRPHGPAHRGRRGRVRPLRRAHRRGGARRRGRPGRRVGGDGHGVRLIRRDARRPLRRDVRPVARGRRRRGVPAASDAAFDALLAVVADLQARGFRPEHDARALAVGLWGYAHGLAVLRRRGSLERHYADDSLDAIGRIAATLLAG